MTAPVHLTADGKSATIPILVSDQTPINLLGRDALCKMGIQMKCSPDGVIIERTGLQLPVATAGETANVYWVGGIEADCYGFLPSKERRTKMQRGYLYTSLTC